MGTAVPLSALRGPARRMEKSTPTLHRNVTSVKLQNGDLNEFYVEKVITKIDLLAKLSAFTPFLALCFFGLVPTFKNKPDAHRMFPCVLGS